MKQLLKASLIVAVLTVVVLAVMTCVPNHNTSTNMKHSVMLADGSDPMPLCRPTKSHPCPVEPPAAARPMLQDVALKMDFKPRTNLQCTPPDSNGCRVCRTHEGPVYVCPA